MPMDAKFVGTWKFDASKSKGIDEFDKVMCQAAGKASEAKGSVDVKHSIAISQEGDKYKFEANFAGTDEKLAFVMKEGETIDDPTPDGKNGKITLTFENGSPVETFTVPGESRKYIIKFTVNGNVMTAVSSFGPASMSEVYNRA